MGLLGWLRKPKSKVSVVPKEEEVSGALRRTLEKAKNYGGDPFYEYRKKKILPEKFEYGMNCFLDRIFESKGEEIAQKTYEELKKMGGCRLQEDASNVDIARLPILFGGKSLAICIDAYNKAVSILQKEKEQVLADKFKEKLWTDNPLFLKRLEDETEYEYAWRLGALSMGFMNKSVELYSQGKLSEGERLRLYSKVIEELVPNCKQVVSRKETDILLFAAGVMGKIIPKEETELFKSLSMMGPSFWHMLWIGILEHFQDAYYGDAGILKHLRDAFPGSETSIITLVNSLVEIFERENRIQIEEWKKKIRNLNISGKQDIIWEEIKNKKVDEAIPRDISLIISVTIFFKLYGYEGSLSKVIPIAEKSLLKFLFNKLAAETMEDVREDLKS